MRAPSRQCSKAGKYDAGENKFRFEDNSCAKQQATDKVTRRAGIVDRVTQRKTK